MESTTATATSGAGNYPDTLTLGTLSAANYSFTLVGGTLTIGAFTACDAKDMGRADVSDVQALMKERSVWRRQKIRFTVAEELASWMCRLW